MSLATQSQRLLAVRSSLVTELASRLKACPWQHESSGQALTL